MTSDFFDIDGVCYTLNLSPIRFGALLKAGAIPEAKYVDGVTGWTAEMLESSSFIKEAEKWNAPMGYGNNRVYYIAAGKFVKIGTTDNLKNRLMQIRTYNPLPIELLYDEPGDRAIERARHWELSRARCRGEWFKRKPVETFIDRIKNEA